MPLCFAYGSNMDRVAMAARCPGAGLIGPARLPRHRLVIMREGYASVVRDPRETVFGLLWDVPLADMAALDRYEGVAGGLYLKRHLAVIGEAGPRRALVYLGRNAGPGVPRPGYLESVLAAAQAAGFPRAYVAGIAALLPRRRSRTDAAGATDALHHIAIRPTNATPFDAGRTGRGSRVRTAGWSWTP